ncbi:hypothetical protein C0J52_07113 [Blattella germanica]|nr:hypothetical protein C0J52_07113 [Blattella germanica]
MTARLEDYEVISVIGTGSFGVCYKVKKKTNGYLYVWKAVSYRGLSEEKKQLLVSEVNLLSELRHPNIVQYYDRIIHKESATLYIVMEWCQGGDLSSLINKCKKTSSFLDEGFVWRVLYQMCRALQACQWQLSKVTVLHRDIKPANVFLDGAGNVKLGDFGLARMLHDDVSFAQTTVGTPYYMSPEVIKGGKYNKKSDIWSLGCLVYELCSLSPPFIGSNIKQLFPRIPAHYSDDLQKIISLILSVEHNLRPTVEVILHHPTVVIHIAQETIKNTLAKEVNATNGVDSSEDELTNDKLNVQQEMENLQISCQNKVLVHNENEGFKKLSNEKIRDIWLSRIHTLKQREASIRLKELALDERERSLAKKEKQIALLDRMTKEKMSRADVYLRQCKDVRSVASSVKSIHQRNAVPDDDLDTTLSADPGDTSFLPTSRKLKPENVTKPTSFVRVGSERRVHFDTLPKAKSKFKQSVDDLAIVTKQKSKVKQSFDDLAIVQKQNQHIASNAIRMPSKILYDIPEYIPSNLAKLPVKEGMLQERGIKTLQDLERIEEDNYRNGILAALNSNQYESRNALGSMGRPPSRAMSWKEERSLWLENKRQAYHLIGSSRSQRNGNKENSSDHYQKNIHRSIGTSTATVSSVPESGLGSLLSFR